MKTQDKIEKLQSEIKSLKQQQSNCNHNWEDAKYDPETISVQDDRNGYETHGVHRFPKPSYHDETKDRWSRECSDCGFKEYTYKQEVVSTKREPKF